MMLPNCPVCLNTDNMTVDNVEKHDSTITKVDYHCSRCGYKSAMVPAALAFA